MKSPQKKSAGTWFGVPEALKSALEDNSCIWRPVPAFPGKALPGKIEEVQIDSVLEELLEEKRLRSTLRTMDVLNGCFNQCDTCLADAPLPSRIITSDSLRRLFSNSAFISMLQPDSFRFGSCGDILDHPDALSIIELALQATEILDSARLEKTGKRHTIKVYTNYRPGHERVLDGLLTLLDRYSERLAAVISLPLNRSDYINQKFVDYASCRPEYFRVLKTTHVDGYPFIEGAMKFGRVRLNVWDVSHPEGLLSVGRVLAPEMVREKVPFSRRLSRFRALEAEQCGFVKTCLNADGLWLMVYCTPYESHTSRLFTLINPENLTTLARLPFHPDFPYPPNWAGGAGEAKRFSPWEVLRREQQYRKAGRIKRALSVIHAI